MKHPFRPALVTAFAAVTGCLPNQAPTAAIGPTDAFQTQSKVIDLLFVVDNSGSMQEEQDALRRAFFETDPDGCPLDDVAHVPSAYQNVSGETVQHELDGCGLLQLLSAEGFDWRVGVITTDVGLCDNRAPDIQGDLFCQQQPDNPACVNGTWGFRPQRGCLQPGGAPGIAAPKVLDASNPDPAAWFAAVLDNIGTFGSPVERGFDAAAMFLDDTTARAPTCEDDLGAFRRDNAELLVVMLTDEDDCSRGDAPWVMDETAGEVCGEDWEFYTTYDAQACYRDASSLPAASVFAHHLASQEPTARVVVIGGVWGGEADGCRLTGADSESVTDVCFPSGGLSNFTDEGQPCGNGGPADTEGLECCTADPATRYEDFVGALDGRGKLMSICEPSLLPQVRDLALALIGVEAD